MNILVFSARDIKHPWAGGAELNIHEMAKRWVKMGYKVTMFCANHYGGKKASGQEIIDGIQITRRGGRYSVYLLAPLFYFFTLRKWADVIIDIEYGIPFFTPLFSKKKKISLIHHIHGITYFTEIKFPLNFIGFFLETTIMPIVYRNVDFVAVSQSSKNNLIALGINDEKIRVIHNGVDQDIYKPGLSKYKLPTLVYLGRVRKYKRLDLIIEMMPRVLEKVPNARFIIAGEGMAKYEVQQKIVRSNLNDSIKMLGYVSRKEKVELLQKAWVYVTASKLEGWGLGVIEANACGTPAVAFRVPGLSDSISDTISGFLVDSVGEFSNRMIKLLTSKHLRDRMSKSALRRAQLFNWNKSAKRFIEVINNI